MEIERLWVLLSDLSKQLSVNKQHCENLQRQADELKTQAIHNNTGFTLRRFNVDITQERFETELERMNATLVLENQALQHENKQLSMLLKDYEGTLENVMSRFRTYAHSTSQHDLNMTKHYESMLNQANSSSNTQAQAQNAELPLLQDPVAVQNSLNRLSSLLRKAMRSIQGEDPSPLSSPSTALLFNASLHAFSRPDPSNPLSSAFSELSTENDSSEDEDERRPSFREENADPSEELFSPDHIKAFGIPPSNDENARLGGFLRLLGPNHSFSGSRRAVNGQRHRQKRSLLSTINDDSSSSISEEEESAEEDDALEGDIEVERLQQENDMLRQLLGIAHDPMAP